MCYFFCIPDKLLHYLFIFIVVFSFYICYIVIVGDDMKEEQKKIILSVVGILVLLVAIFGITYAFFQYVKIGSKNNTITSGKLFIEYTEGTSYINITDVYPIPDTQALQSGTLFKFSVSGYIEGSNTLAYDVYAVQGDAYSGRNRLKDNEIKIKLTGANSKGGSTGITIDHGYDGLYGAIVGADGSLKVQAGDYSDDLHLASGIITSNDSSVTEVHSYELKMWISDSIVHIGDTTGVEGNIKTYSYEDYETLYYSMKINVIARNGALTQTD